jgi:excisionase family DNA binding protein
MTLPFYLTVAEAAEHLKLSRSTIYRLISEGRVGYLHIGGSYRIDRLALERAATPPARGFLTHCAAEDA